MNHSANPVTLRPLELRDADVIARWAADPEFCHAADWTPGLPYPERQRFHQRLIQSRPPDLIRLGVIHRGVLVGYVDLHGDEPHRREIGFLIGERSRWGRGLGRWAAAAGIDHGFDKVGLQEIWAQAFDSNQRSVRILQRLGLLEIGRGDEGVFLDQPTYYRQFAITVADWACLRTHTEVFSAT